MEDFKELEKFIKDEIAKIEADERFDYESASVFASVMRAKVNAYKSILEKIKELKGAKYE